MKRTLITLALVIAAATLLMLGTAVTWAPTADAFIPCEDCAGYPDACICGGSCNGETTRTCGEYRAAGCTGWLQGPGTETLSETEFLESLHSSAEVITDADSASATVTAIEAEKASAPAGLALQH